MPGKFVVVLVTCGTRREARKIAGAVVEKRLAACVNVLGGVESVYTWKGKVERARGILLVMKTEARRVKALERAVHALHSYETPEFIVLPVTGGSAKYLKWLAESVK